MDFKFVKNGFINQGTTYIFGSKLYPIANKKQGMYFTSENTYDMPDELKNKIDECLTGINMPIGKCYENSNVILKILKKALKGYKVEFYSGWCFTAPTYPIHHSFILIDNKYIIDTGMRKEEQKLILAIMSMSKKLDKVALANSVKNIHKNINNKKFSEAYVCGKSLKHICYYASPDTYKNAISTSNYIVNLGFKHPSMVRPLMNVANNNHMQQLLLKENITNKKTP